MVPVSMVLQMLWFFNTIEMISFYLKNEVQRTRRFSCKGKMYCYYPSVMRTMLDEALKETFQGVIIGHKLTAASILFTVLHEYTSSWVEAAKY